METCFHSWFSLDTAREALRRVRGGGAAIVPQISAKHYPAQFGVFDFIQKIRKFKLVWK